MLIDKDIKRLFPMQRLLRSFAEGPSMFFQKQIFKTNSINDGSCHCCFLQARGDKHNHTRSCVNLCCFYWLLTLFLPGIVKFLCSHRSALEYVLTHG